MNVQCEHFAKEESCFSLSFPCLLALWEFSSCIIGAFVGVQSPAFTPLLCNSRGGSPLVIQEGPNVIGTLFSTNNVMSWDWRDSSAVKSTHWFSKGPGFDSQHPFGWEPSACSSGFKESQVLFWLLWASVDMWPILKKICLYKYL